jgi:arginase
MQDIIRDGLGVTLQNIKRRLDNLSASSIYLSIDIDVIDPNIAPGTGVPVPNGINKDMLYQFIDVIANTGKIKGAELVEVNPTIDDDDNKTSILAIDIIEYLLMRICDNYTNEALD